MDATLAETLAERITRLRAHRRLNQAELARRAGVSRSYISRLEAGNYTDPGAPAMARLADVLDVSADYLLNGADCPPSEADLPPDLRAQISQMPYDYRALVGELVAQGNRLPDTEEGRAAFVQAIRVAVGYLQSVIERGE